MFLNAKTNAGLRDHDQLTQDDLGWKPQIYLQDLYVLATYPLCTRVCTERADGIIRAGVRLSPSGVSEKEVDQIHDYVEERSTPSCFRDAMVNGEFFGAGFQILFIDDGRPMHAPVDLENVQDVIAIIPAQRYELTPIQWDYAPMEPMLVWEGGEFHRRYRVNKNYGRPLLYSYHPWMYGTTAHGTASTWGPSGEEIRNRAGVDPWKEAGPEIVSRGMQIHNSRVCMYPGYVLPRILQRENGGYPDPTLRGSLESIISWYSHVYDAREASRHLAELVYSTDKLTQMLDAPQGLIVTAEQARTEVQRMLAQAQATASNRGVRTIEPQEKLEYLGRPMSGFDQITQVKMIDVATDSGYPLELIFRVSPPGGIGAAGAGRFIWDVYETDVQGRYRNHIAPQQSKIFEYSLLARRGPVRKRVPFRLEMGSLSRETPLERAQRRLAESQALDLDLQNRVISRKEWRARAKSSNDGFISLDDKEDEALEAPELAEGFLPPDGVTDSNIPELSDLPDRWSGLEVRLQNRMGEPRFGAILPCHYGDIVGTMAPDGEPVDCYCGPVIDSPMAYIIRQVNPDTGAFDELKVMLGFASVGTAVSTYCEAVDTPARCGGVESIPVKDLLARLAR